ncbi:MAG: 5-formyltetrahydrofolate cyclo-ligase [Oceanococcus sp.]
MNADDARAALRKQLRRRRMSIPALRRHQLAKQLATQLDGLPALRYAQDVAAYSAMGSEISLQPWLQQQHRRIYLPRVQRQHLAFHPNAHALHDNRFGISEPRSGRPRPVWALSALLIPLLGFDALGNRIGQGGGYYDRCLAQLRWRRPWLIGIAFDEQYCEHIPTAPWDQALDAVVTPTQILLFRK